MSSSTYSKRAGTSGIRGQLYETKLLALLYFRATHTDSIEEFHLATNVDDIGAFDDICFRAKVKGINKPIAVFIQAKHRENDKQILDFPNDLAKYFDSYLKIRHKFEVNNDDVLFKGVFDETECVFVLYTTVKDDVNSDLFENTLVYCLNELIDTGGTARRLETREKDVQCLWKIAMQDQITLLAGMIAKYLFEESNFQMMMDNELMLRYHVILANKVFNVSNIKPERHRIAAFRKEFFETNEEFLVLLKEKLYTEVLKKRKIHQDDINCLLFEILSDLSDFTRLSKLIGTVINYNNGQIEFRVKVDEIVRERFKNVYICQSTVNKAYEMGAKEILTSRTLKVPTAFGNKDLTITGNDMKIERRLNHLKSKMLQLIEKSGSNNIGIIDDCLEKGLLQINGGISGAVGNLLVFDEDPKLMKFTNDSESLENLAKRLYIKLKTDTPNLHEYKFRLKTNKFPKLTFDCSEYEENLARDFLNKLFLYTNQADENGVGDKLKHEIDYEQQNQANCFQVKTDAIFLRYHDEIQKWWMLPKQASYLTKDSNLFENVISNIIEGPLIRVMNFMYMHKNNFPNCTFSDEAVSSLKLSNQSSCTVIITEYAAFTVAKVTQYLINKDHVVLDLEYISNLPRNDCNGLLTELNSNERIVLFICDKIQNFKNGLNKPLENIVKALRKKKTIVVTSHGSVEILKKYLRPDNIVRDERTGLVDMNQESQRRILNTAKVVFQGVEETLDSIIDDESASCITAEVLKHIVNKETVVVGKAIGSANYEEIKHLYIDRRLKKKTSDVKQVKTLYDIQDQVVLVTAEPGMGKSTLLTHLAIKTKELDPKAWIIRINLLEYSREFSMWKKNKTKIDTLETINFLCKVILREKLGKKHKVEIALEETNDIVYLKHCTGDHWTMFELKLFLHFYNRGKLIILFDGFDEICPHYSNEVIKCLKTVSNYPRKHRLWITSRSYNEVRTILQREFGASYEIDFFSYIDKQKYLDTFWKHNLVLQAFNTDQLENVQEFLEFVTKLESQPVLALGVALYEVYIHAGHYLINQIEYTHIPLWRYDKHIDDTYYIQLKDEFFMAQFHDDNSERNPLHLFLTADYFQSNLKDIDKNPNKWNLDSNTYNFYERFLETKLKTIRFEEKNKMDIYNPDIIIVYGREYADFVKKHKQLAAYAIFNVHSDKLFNTKQMEDVQATIKFIEEGGEKTGLIYSIENNIPIFIHMTFTEYFAVEYVCDSLKAEERIEYQKSWMDFIFNTMFSSDRYLYIRNIFDYKIKMDTTLLNVLDNNKKVIFNLLIGQGRAHAVFFKKLHKIDVDHALLRNNGQFWAVTDAITDNLSNLLVYIISILENYLNKSNLDEFLTIVQDTDLLIKSFKENCDFIIIFIIDIVKKIDITKLNSVVHDNFSYLTNVTNFVEMSNEELLKIIRDNYVDKYELAMDERPPSVHWGSASFSPDLMNNMIASSSASLSTSRSNSRNSLSVFNSTSNVSLAVSPSSLSPARSSASLPESS